MSYKVIHYFEDLQDKSHPYSVGDIFPRSGLTVSEERLAELSSENNRRKKPLIKKIEEVLEEKGEYTKTKINRLSLNELRELAEAECVDGYGNLTGGELKKLLIKHFKL